MTGSLSLLLTAASMIREAQSVSPNRHRHEALSSERHCKFNEVVLSMQTLVEALGGGAPFSGRFSHQPLGSGAGPVKERAESRRGLKEHLQPAVSKGLQMAHEFELAQFSPFLRP